MTTVTRQTLQDNFALLSDDELLRMINSGELTELARDVAGRELRRRGVDSASLGNETTSKPPPDDPVVHEPAPREAGWHAVAAKALGVVAKMLSAFTMSTTASWTVTFDPPRPGERSDDGDLVLLARFYNPIDGQLLRSRLDAEGVPAIVADAHMAQANMLLAIGVRVLVPEQYLARGREILRDIHSGKYALDDRTDVGQPV